METGKRTGDGPGDEELINTPSGPSSLMKSLGKGIQAPCSSEEHSITLGESSSSKESLTPAIQGIVIHTAGPNLAQPNLEVVAIVAPASTAPAQSNVGMLVTFPGVAPAEPNVGPIVSPYSVAPAQINAALVVDPSSAPLVEPNVAVNVPALGLAFAQPSVALLLVAAAPVVAPSVALLLVAAAPVVAPVQPHVAPNVVPPIGTTVASPRVDPARLNAAAVAHLASALVGQNPAINVARPVVAVQQNVAPIVAPPALAPAQPNAATVVAPPGAPPALPNVIDINGGLTRSQLRPLRTFEFGQEGNLWPKL